MRMVGSDGDKKSSARQDAVPARDNAFSLPLLRHLKKGSTRKIQIFSVSTEQTHPKNVQHLEEPESGDRMLCLSRRGHSHPPIRARAHSAPVHPSIFHLPSSIFDPTPPTPFLPFRPRLRPAF